MSTYSQLGCLARAPAGQRAAAASTAGIPILLYVDDLSARRERTPLLGALDSDSALSRPVTPGAGATSNRQLAV